MARVAAVVNASLRDVRGSAEARRMRQEGRVPAVLYGHKEKTISISLPEKEMMTAIRSGARMVDLVIGQQQEKALIKEAQYDPVSLRLLHVDFARVALDEKVTVSVAIVTTGAAKGTAQGGNLDLVLKELEVECLATNIPSEIKVKVTDLDVGQSILVKELELPPGVVPAPDVDRETIVVTVHAPREEVVETPVVEGAEAEEAAEPEVIVEKEREARAEAKEREKEAEKEQ